MGCVAIAQFTPVSDKEANVARVTGLIQAAAARGANLVVLPELAMFGQPELGLEYVRSAEPLDGSFVNSLQAQAATAQIAVICGMNEFVTDRSKFSNTVVGISQDGGIEVVYRKMHLYDAFGYRESEWVIPGDIDPPSTLSVGDLEVGIQTCYDLRFPEVTRRLVDAGAHLVATPAAWTAGAQKLNHWKTLLSARAIESTVYIAGAGQTGPHCIGNSTIVDPTGITLCSLGMGEEVAVAAVSKSTVDTVRETNPSLLNRRFVSIERSGLTNFAAKVDVARRSYDADAIAR